MTTTKYLLHFAVDINTAMTMSSFKQAFNAIRLSAHFR
jgi:hypothetical protein